MFGEVNSFMNALDDEIEKMVLEAYKLEKQLGSCHNLVSTYDVTKKLSPSNGIQMEGYLFKRSSTAFKTWNRRWFYLTNNQLLYRKRIGKRNTLITKFIRAC